MKTLVWLLSAPCIYILNAHTLVTLWGWFLVSYGIQVPTYPQALGIIFIINFLTFQTTWYEEKKIEHLWAVKLLTAWMKPLVYLGFGWVFTLFM